MRIDIITLFPDFFKNSFSYSIFQRAIKNKIIEIKIHDLRKFTSNKQKSVDDYQYGGGAGMVICIEPIYNCIKKLKSERHYDEIIYLTPDGEKLNQSTCNEISTFNNIILLCGHYKGIDQRARDMLITKEISIGDYVLSGGEIPALVLTDSIMRIIPGAISDETSALTDSFQDNLIAPPVYTRPSNFMNLYVPKVLLSGNKKLIDKWREDKSVENTKKRRPDLI